MLYLISILESYLVKLIKCMCLSYITGVGILNTSFINNSCKDIYYLNIFHITINISWMKTYFPVKHYIVLWGYGFT